MRGDEISENYKTNPVLGAYITKTLPQIISPTDFDETTRACTHSCTASHIMLRIYVVPIKCFKY